MNNRLLALLTALALLAACTTAPPPAVTPQGDDRFLIDPRIGYATAAPALDRKFDAAWNYLLAGNEAEATRRLEAIRKTNPDYAPAQLAMAAMQIRAGRFADAGAILKPIVEANADYTAARVYEAEIAVREKRTRNALELYQKVAAMKGAPPTAAERVTAMRAALYAELVAGAATAKNDEAVAMLREALTIDPDAVEPRLSLSQRLLSEKRYDEARSELTPLLDKSADRTEVQEILAEVDAGRGRYEEAIARFERLARRTNEERFRTRLTQLKEEWSAANMPAYYRTALDSVELTRAELAVLLYWNVPSVRFAQNLGAPPIATDVGSVEGREEIIRAIAIGLYEVDPVTRTVGPSRTLTRERLARALTRLLTMRGAPCARGIAADEVLRACAIDDPVSDGTGEEVVTGREAQRLLVQVAKALQ